MLSKLIGPEGKLWRTGVDDEAGQTASPSLVVQQPPVVATQMFTPGVAVDPEILESTRKATFEIPGSVYARFAAESKKLEQVPMDPITRIKAVVAMLSVSPVEIMGALSSTHRGALDSWKASIVKAKEASISEKIGTRETNLQGIATEDQRIQGEISQRQAQLQKNAEQAQVLRQEITSARAEIDQKSQQYANAVTAVEAELAQIINTLQSIK
jgi:hypothetical protein